MRSCNSLLGGAWRRLALALAGCTAGLGLSQQALAVGDVVISQVWGGGGTVAGQPNADYVELFNRTANPIDMTGWSVQIASGTGSAWAKLDLAATIQPYSYYLVRVQNTSGTGTAFTADAVFLTSSSVLLSSSGKAALRSITTLFTGTCPVTDATQSGTIVDFVGYGSSTGTTCREGTTNAPAGSTSGSGSTPFRAGGGCIDSDQNNIDFALGVPIPRNASTTSPGPCSTPGACCNDSTGVCSIVSGSTNCPAGSTYQGDNSTCGPSTCSPTGACCNGATGGTCTVLTAVGCAGVSGFYQGNGTLCSPTPCTTGACCFPNGTCCNLFSALCTAQGGTASAAGLTCTEAGNCIPAPANDTCATAIAITAGSPVIGNNFAATSGNDGLTTNCTSTTARLSKGVWFTFTPAATGIYDLTTCGSTFDCTLGVFRIGNCADLTTWTHVACDDDACPTGAASFCGTTSSASAAVIEDLLLEGGLTYHIVLGSDSTTATSGGNFTLTLIDQGAGVVGACCNDTHGQCELRTSAGCAASVPAATYMGDGSVCSPNPCLNQFGACCYTGGICLLRIQAQCTDPNWVAGTMCAPDPCILEACCNNTTGACTVRPAGTCTASETGRGADTACTPTNPCPPSGACCNPCTFACSTTDEDSCAAGSVWNIGSTCSPTNICNTFAPVPSNDLACNASPLTLGVQVTGVMGNASSTDDGLASTCDTTPGAGLWYTFVPSTTGFHLISTCGATFDTILTVMTGPCADPFSMTIVECDSDSCVGGTTEPVVCGTGSSSASAAEIPFVFLDASTTYYIRLQAGGTTTVGGTFPLVVNTVAAGACCTTAGACAVDEAADCTATTESYLGDNTTCSPGACPASGSCCNDCTFVCTTTFQSTCAAGSTWTSGGVCSPNTCGHSVVPPNDLPCNATALALNTPATGTIPGATSTGDGLPSTCDAAATKGIWFTYSPAQSGNYTISTCGSTFGTVLTVMTGDCATPDAFSQLACDDDTCIGGTGDPAVCGTANGSTAAALIPDLALSAGTTYYIRLQVDGTGNGGTYTLVIRPAVTGACCAGNGDCVVTLEALCPAQCAGVYQGNNTVCTPGLCPISIPDTCATALTISGNFVATLDNNCAANENDEPADTCNSTTAVGLMNSIWLRFIPGENGQLTGSVDGPSYDLSGALYSGACGAANLTLVACWDDPEPWDLAVPEAGSTLLTAGTTYFLAIGDWGTGEGGGQTPVNITIPGPANGACCSGSTCSLTTLAACTGANTSFAGAGTVCNAPGNNTTPCCKADFNHVGGITVQDIFDFLAAYFSQNPAADINGAGGVTVQDIFDFLAAYFAGGC